MPDIYRKGDYDIAGFAVGVAELPRVVDAGRVRPGDVILGLTSSGIHSNGYTLVRKIVEKAKIDLHAEHPRSDGQGANLRRTAVRAHPNLCSVHYLHVARKVQSETP